MTTPAGGYPDWHGALRRYILASLALHLAWEIAQLPLYTLWSEPLAKRAFALLHCTLGDAMIAGLSLMVALALFAPPSWPSEGARRIFVVTLLLGIAYTIFSEWLNVSVRGSWAYSELMPVIPIMGTGLTPLLQWLLIPAVAQWLAIGRYGPQ